MLDMLRLAAQVAIQKYDRTRSFYLGAVAVRKDQAIVKSANGAAYIPFPASHAEARVLKKAGRDSVLYVARIARKDGKMALARPCNGCWIRMRRHAVKKCYYSISETEYGIIVFNNNSFVERVKSI